MVAAVEVELPVFDLVDIKGDRNVLDTSHHSTIVLRSSIVRYHPLAYDFFKDELTAQRTGSIL